MMSKPGMDVLSCQEQMYNLLKQEQTLQICIYQTHRVKTKYALYKYAIGAIITTADFLTSLCQIMSNPGDLLSCKLINDFSEIKLV